MSGEPSLHITASLVSDRTNPKITCLVGVAAGGDGGQRAAPQKTAFFGHHAITACMGDSILTAAPSPCQQK